ncbi:MAG: hypothetical protein ACK5LJ_18085 [Paracoccus sp. (in: a-proteobacteria)]
MNVRDSGFAGDLARLERLVREQRAATVLDSSKIDFPEQAITSWSGFCAFDARPAHIWRVKFQPDTPSTEPPLAVATLGFEADPYYYPAGYSFIDEMYIYIEDDIDPPDTTNKYFMIYHNSETYDFAGHDVDLQVGVRSTVSGTASITKVV